MGLHVKKNLYKAVAMGSALVGSTAFASSGTGDSSDVGLIAIGAGLTIAITTFGAATAQGRASVSALEGIARNPNARKEIFVPFLLGLVFMELQALLAFVIAIMLVAKI